MSASSEELIAINSLLIEREAELARVYATESRINQLLGADYPFEAPGVTLPSSIKRKKPTKAKKVKAKAAVIKPRRLDTGEAAYRITWTERGQSTQQNAADLKHLNALLKEPLPSMKLLKVQTIDIAGAPVETLYDATF
ncbi:hypothetical protein QEH59_08130 [Coraliomargarita sp. SDUM461004]|uniref:Transposase n=1 Tax=Thalassobacterium sedimentorum TaxID=3041258 RepID=A0ABU1AHU7_9BACT|nr:hypothetical protein [Coraliomargarita sp. SDUM461004]MDQ8194390.1 hypothetical protein [Coraliomargarita sp. SDUM461004]